MPKVSVLIPIFNVEKYLRECLDSVVGQTLSDIEIICINDGSTDNSLAIIEEYAQRDSRVIVIDKPNSGYGDSMNKGIEKATGDYIGIVESDDWAEPDMFERLWGLSQHGAIDIVKSDYYVYFTEGERTSRNKDLGEVIDKALVGRTIRPLDYPHIMFQRPAIWSGMYRRAFLNENCIKFLPTPGASYQDTGFAFKTWVSAQTAVFTEDAYLHYRSDNDNSSVASPGKIMCVADEFSSVKEFLKSKGLFDELGGLFQVVRWGGYSWNIARLNAPLAAEFIDFASEQLREEKKASQLDLHMCDANQVRGITEVMEDPKMAKARRYSQEDALVSIIVPVHNDHRYVRQCLDAILNQSLSALDVIMVDDGSIDSSIDILEEYYRREPKMRLISQHNHGLAYARNIGLDHAAADFVMFCDADDYLEPNAVEVLRDAVIRNDSQMAVGLIRPFFEGSTRTAADRVRDVNYYRLRLTGTHHINGELLKATDMSVCNKIFARNRIEDLHVRFPNGLKFEDSYFVNSFCWGASKATYLPANQPVYNYRRRPGSLMSTVFEGSSFSADHMEVAFMLFDVLEQRNLQDQYGQYYMKLLQDYVGFAIRYARPEDRGEIWEEMAAWFSLKYTKLKALDEHKAKVIYQEIPTEYRYAFVGSGLQSLPSRVYRKARRMAKKAMWQLAPSYRAAASVKRDLAGLEARVSALAAIVSATAEQQREIQHALNKREQGGKVDKK